MQNAGLELNASFSCTTRQATQEVMKKAFAGSAPPTAVYTSNDLTTRFVLQALGDLCLKVPEQIAIIGFDDFDLAEVLQPTLTVVRQPAQKVGRVAAELLFAHILQDEAQNADDEADQTPEPGKRIVLPVELILRRSCGCETASQTYPAPVEAREVPC